MGKYLKVLGDGQIWDLRGIDGAGSRRTFEDLFSGRALADMAAQDKIFSRFKDRGRITGLSVTKALLSNNPTAEKKAKQILQKLAENGALGIEALERGRGFKKNWSRRQKKYWQNIDTVIIGGGVSEAKTGGFLIGSIKNSLARKGLSDIRVLQAIFPGKESGILGAVINILGPISAEARKKGLNQIAAIGIDIGRDEIGVGVLVIDAGSQEVLRRKNECRIYKDSVKTPGKEHLKKFLDARSDYTAEERRLGLDIRSAILNKIADLVVKARRRAEKEGLVVSSMIAVAVPGGVGRDGSILHSTDYLPFLRKKDGFNFSRALTGILRKKTLQEADVCIINDGIAAGIANAHFLIKGALSKFVFLGVGSGLGGCVGIVQ